MRVLFVTQYFPPESGAAPARASHLVRALRTAGHDVDVLTGLPNHPTGVVPEGFRRSSDERTPEGARVVRSWLYASPRRDTVRRIMNQVSFGVTARFRGARLGDYDVVVATVPPPFHGRAAAHLARRLDVPFVVDVRDDWPRVAVESGFLRDGVLTRAFGRLVRSVYREADRLVVVTPGMQRRFAGTVFPAERISVVTNGGDTESSVPVARDEGSTFRAVYAGTHGQTHGMDVIIEAAELLRDEPIEFLLVGDGPVKASLVERTRAEGLSRVRFEATVPSDEAAKILARADAAIVTMAPVTFLEETIPAKLFDCLSAGTPVIGALAGDAADVLTASEGGIVVAPGDVIGMAEALRSLASDAQLRRRMGEAGRAYVEAHYSRAELGRRFVGVVEEAVASGRRGRRPAPPGAYRAVKRFADMVAAGLGLALLSPLLLVVSIAVRLDSPGPALFVQRRAGRWNREFRMLKFRTMHAGTPDVATHLLSDAEDRVTRVGAWLRRTSLDELPQLFNVLRGDMSIVGPRPALYNQYDLIAMRSERDIDALRPGLTGWAQVNGRDDLPMDRKVDLDAEYARRISAGFDIGVVWRTVFVAASQRGAG